MRKLFYILTFCILTLSLSAQDNEIIVSCRQNVSIGEQFQITFEVNGDCSNFKAPNFRHFQLVGGPYSSSSSSVQIINGSITHTQKKSYSYYLAAIEEGTFTIPSASAKIDDKQVKSEPFEIVVSGGSQNNIGSSSASTGSQKSGQTSTSTKNNGKDLFVEGVPTRKSLYLGEQALINYNLYFSVPISQLQVSKAPNYNKFWTKDITNNNGTPQQSTVVINNRQYNKADIMRIVIVPQSTGSLTIDPLSLSCYTQVRNNNSSRGYDPFDDFFNGVFSNSYSTIKREISSQPINIEVKPLPTVDKPNSFLGAVGQYTFNSNIDKTQLKTNEAFTIIYTVSGQGNIDLLELPKPVFPPDFEVYDPKINTKTKNGANGISGTKSVEYIVIPRTAGSFNLKAVEFSYFDPKKEKYVILSSDSFTIEVEKGANDNSAAIYHSGQKDIKYIGTDIQHINTSDTKLYHVGNAFYRSNAYWFTLLGITCFFIVIYIIYKSVRKFNKNEVLVRNRTAERTAKKRLKKAETFMKSRQTEQFYVEFSQALWGYISDKLNIPLSKLSMDTVSEMMREKSAPDEVINKFVDALNECEFARFAPGSVEEKMESLYKKGVIAIVETEQNLKKV